MRHRVKHFTNAPQHPRPQALALVCREDVHVSQVGEGGEVGDAAGKADEFLGSLCDGCFGGVAAGGRGVVEAEAQGVLERFVHDGWGEGGCPVYEVCREYGVEVGDRD